MVENHGATAPPPWRDRSAYAYTASLSLREWAWEFLRRNPDFVTCWKEAQVEYGLYGQDGATTIILAMTEALSLRKWGCLYANSPELDALSASVLWCPDICPSVLHLTAIPLARSAEKSTFQLNKIACPSILLEMAGGPQHLLFSDGGRWLQLALTGVDVLKAVRLIGDIDTGHPRASHQLRALQCFNDLRLCGRLVPSRFQSDPLSPRLGVVLQALDGSLAGASYAEIAAAIVGKERANAQWHDLTRSLRDKTRRAIYRGRKLMCGGYRDFLC